MGKGPPPQWNRRDCRFDHLVAAALTKKLGTVMVYGGIDTWERADDIRRGIYRCASHRGLTAAAGPGGRTVSGDPAEVMGIRKTGQQYELRYKIVSKNSGRRRHLDTYGPDRANWPYDPRRRATPDELAAHANRNELGAPVAHD